MIRKHTNNDLESILTIWLNASNLAHPFLNDAFVKEVAHAMRHIYIPNSETWVYEENNTVLGFIGMQGNEIGGLFVDPEYHSKGIGSNLVNYILNMHDTLEVEVFKNNSIGNAFYKKYGFKQIKSYFFEAAQQEVLRLKFDK